jgi:peptidoglycan hydrolase-like amidase
MNIMNRSRLRHRLSFALTFTLSGCAQFLIFVSTDTFATTQKDTSYARSPRTQQRLDFASYDSPDGPIIRVALMTDVTSASVSCSSGLVVNRSSKGLEQGEKVSIGSVRVELRKQPGTIATLPSSAARYRVFVGSSSEARNARKLEDRLKLEFFDPVVTTFDDMKKQYVVTIGRFTNRDDAAKMVDRLLEAGYKAPRIMADSSIDTRDTLTPELVTDTNARAAKYKAEPGASGRAVIKADRGPAHMVAIASDRVVASSEDEFIVSAGDESAIVARAKTSKSDFAPTPVPVRVGNKDYRGEIHLILNPRGRINVVNALPLERYLRGVVPMEVSATAYAELEAIKAQAVASRSFALASLGHHSAEGYDLVADSRSQVYGGFVSERELTNRAIEETRGIAAVFPNEDGRLTPIQALYTANCGGRTENNEEVFGGKALPYLRSVVCVPERQSLAGRDIVTTRTSEPLVGTEGLSIASEVALLSVLGLPLPHRVTSHYLRGAQDQDEVKSWAEQIARLSRKDYPVSARGDVTRLAEFARLVASSIYGEGQASVRLSSNDVDYLLAGFRFEQLPREARADVAMLLKDGILRLPAESAFDGRTTITRGLAIETLARALFLRSQTSGIKSETSGSRFQIPALRSEIAAPAEKGRLMIAPPNSTASSTQTQSSRFAKMNKSASGTEVPSAPQGGSRESNSPKVARKDIASWALTPQAGSRRGVQYDGVEIAEAAWLFRAVGGESYAVDRLTLIGGERVTYHLNAAGQVDFLEATMSERGVSIDRSSGVAPWQERISIEELQQRLTRAHVQIGRLAQIEPVSLSASRRIIEVDVKGDGGRARLGRSQIRSALGLKEHLYTIDHETDARGRLIAFVFTGRGLGHGVGMCQAGAYRLAKEGMSYTVILQKYYTGIKVQEMY